MNLYIDGHRCVAHPPGVAPTQQSTRTSDAATCRPRSRGVRRSATHDRVAAALKALGDSNRLAMMQMIVDAGELCSCDIERHFDLTQPTISHHLKLLRSAGLIEGERRGTWIYYRPVARGLRLVAEHPVFSK